jgi:hypothetical protein
MFLKTLKHVMYSDSFVAVKFCWQKNPRQVICVKAVTLLGSYTQHSLLVGYQRSEAQFIDPIFKDKCHPSWTAWPFKMGLIGCPEISVTS